jgi:peptidoglycan/LPS O-acetylase OafA/YrhL
LGVRVPPSAQVSSVNESKLEHVWVPLGQRVSTAQHSLLIRTSGRSLIELKRNRRDLVKSEAPRGRKRQDIQLLRAVSVLAVVGYHFGLAGFDYGFLGVDVFLVISGYLVGGGLLKELKTSGQIEVLRFFTRRIKRLLPASIVVVIATTILLYVTNELTTRDLRHALWSSLYVQNINLSVEDGDYLGKDLLPTYFVHFWSLSLEEQFYVFVPVLLILIARTKLTQRPLLIFSTIGIISLILSPSDFHRRCFRLFQPHNKSLAVHSGHGCCQSQLR